MDDDMDRMTPREAILHGLDRIGNAVCLDFVNTVHSRFEHGSEDYMKTYSELLLWAADGGIISHRIRRRLEKLARQNPIRERQVRRQAGEVREILYRIFRSVARGSAANAGDLDALNIWLARCSAHRRLVRGRQGFRWEWVKEPLRLDALLWPILDSAAALLVSESLGRVKQCPAPDGCGWLFLDVSKNRSRRWCDMKACGNVSTVRRFYERRSSKSVSS
jgi:predicted RNA-binding Zn ribbon-like protein